MAARGERAEAGVIEYLEKVDPPAAARARQGYACFDAYGEDVQRYGYAASLHLDRSCEDAVVEQLVALRRHAAEYATRDGRIAADDYFVAEQNARVVRDAKTYYRAMFRGGAVSWNVRDRHMMYMLEALLDHAARAGRPARAVVWAHNSHLGDGPRRTEPRAALRRVRPSRQGSYEWLFHQTGLPMFVLALARPGVATVLAGPLLERAIGVIYRPETERASHYFDARLPEQFDVVVHVDPTRAVEPLERWGRHEVICPRPIPHLEQATHRCVWRESDSHSRPGPTAGDPVCASSGRLPADDRQRHEASCDAALRHAPRTGAHRVHSEPPAATSGA